MQDSRGTSDSHQTQYRPDVDGLRAVAVLAVIAFHVLYRAMPGGYLGVDIFFVLSGYLITSVVWREALNGQFSIARFYERRVRRILPALLIVLLAATAAAMALLLPVDLKGFAKSVLATLASAANVYFWRDTDYFGGAATLKPLLHTWSLGVEEQFYVIFPLLVILCSRWRRSALLPVVAVLVVLSFAANLVVDSLDASSTAFYLLPTRAWEIGAGSLLALAPVRPIANRLLRHGLIAIVVALLVYSLCSERTFGPAVPPTFWAVLATVGAIHLGAAGGNWLTLALSWGPLVWIGQISYSLYLWHWPVLVFTRYYLAQDLTLTPVAAVFVVALTFALAVLSWRYVERPFRNRTMPVRRVLWNVAIGSAAIALASVAALATHGLPARYSPEVNRMSAAVDTEYRCGLRDTIAFGASHGCVLALPSRNPDDATVALVGNSHAQMYAPIVGDILREQHQGGIIVRLNGCLPMVDFNLSKTCMVEAARNLSALESLPHIKVVILSMTWEFPDTMYTTAGPVQKQDDARAMIESLDRLIQDLIGRGKAVVLVGPIQEPGRQEASIAGRQLAFHHAISEPVSSSTADFMARHGAAIAHYASRSDIVFIRPDRVECPQDRCEFFADGASLFADSNHIAEGALPLFRPEFERGLRPVLEHDGQTAPVAQ